MLQDPVGECRHFGVHAGSTGPGAAGAPRNDADQRVGGGGSAHEQRPARVALARVDAAGVEAGRRCQQRHHGHLELVGQRTSCFTVEIVPSIVIDQFPVIRMTVYHRVADLSSFNYMEALCSHKYDCLRPKHELELIQLHGLCCHAKWLFLIN